MIKEDPIIREFLKASELRDPLNPHDALFGGRTNAAKLYHRIIGDERIKYVDITSLYPFVQKYCEYPIGHPEIITENFDKNIVNYYKQLWYNKM